jgi:hypothetical protein
MPGRIPLGTDWIISALGIKDAANQQVNVTGYRVAAVARAYSDTGEIVARWSTTPDGDSGTVFAGGIVIDRIQLVGTPELTAGWSRIGVVLIQAKLTDPDTGQTARIIDDFYDVSPDSVTNS